ILPGWPLAAVASLAFDPCEDPAHRRGSPGRGPARRCWHAVGREPVGDREVTEFVLLVVAHDQVLDVVRDGYRPSIAPACGDGASPARHDRLDVFGRPALLCSQRRLPRTATSACALSMPCRRRSADDPRRVGLRSASRFAAPGMPLRPSFDRVNRRLDDYRILEAYFEQSR